MLFWFVNHLCFACKYIGAPHRSCTVPMELKRMASPGTGITDGCKLPCGYWDPSLGSLQGQKVLTTAEPSPSGPNFNISTSSSTPPGLSSLKCGRVRERKLSNKGCENTWEVPAWCSGGARSKFLLSVKRKEAYYHARFPDVGQGA